MVLAMGGQNQVQWTIEKDEMIARHILFQDEDRDTYVETLIACAIKVAQK